MSSKNRDRVAQNSSFERLQTPNDYLYYKTRNNKTDQSDTAVIGDTTNSIKNNPKMLLEALDMQESSHYDSLQSQLKIGSQDSVINLKQFL